MTTTLLSDKLCVKLVDNEALKNEKWFFPTPFPKVHAVLRIRSHSPLVAGSTQFQNIYKNLKDVAADLEKKDINDAFHILLEHQKNIYGKPVIKNFQKFIRELFGEELFGEESPEGLLDVHVDTYVITNTSNHYGSICLFDEAVKNKLNELMPEGYIILPSSVHEVILMPIECGLDTSCLKKMVYDINTLVVQKQDFFTNRVFRYVNGVYNEL